MGIFGWSYPAGAENDPSAPYNQPDPPEIDIEDPVAFTAEYCPYCHEHIAWNGDGWTCKCGFDQEATTDDYLRARPQEQIDHEKILKAYLGQLPPTWFRALLSAYEASWRAGLNGSTVDQAVAATATSETVASAIHLVRTEDLENIEAILIQETRD